MTNYNAKKINDTLGIEIFDQSVTHRLQINNFTKKKIKELHIEDLIDLETKKGTPRLAMFVRDILFYKETTHDIK